MNSDQKLQLQKMIQVNNVEDQTELIRELKHSYLLQNDINNLLLIMKKYGNDEQKVHEEGMGECGFLFTYYTDIYNKIRKNEIDLSILNKFLNVLRAIEDGELDQHEGSFYIGTYLKELYIDSALKKVAKLDEKRDEEKEEKEKVVIPVLPISWKEYKNKVKIY